MRIKPILMTFSALCAVQICFALPQVTDADDASSSFSQESGGYLASGGPVAAPGLMVNAPQSVAQKSQGINDDLLTKINTLEQEVQQLQGRVDELQHALKQSQAEQAQQFLILNKKLATAPAPVAVPVATKPKPVVSAVVVPTKVSVAAQPATPEDQEKKTYDAAYGLVSSKAYADAVDAFIAYLKIYPDGRYAANANYWLAELAANLQNYPESLNYLQVVVKQYPQSTKVPDALLKLGIINQRLGNDAKAQEWLAQLVKEYPQSASAQSAKEYIK
jgi:tol-pal system protein YbgF